MRQCSAHGVNTSGYKVMMPYEWVVVTNCDFGRCLHYSQVQHKVLWNHTPSWGQHKNIPILWGLVIFNLDLPGSLLFIQVSQIPSLTSFLWLHKWLSLSARLLLQIAMPPSSYVLFCCLFAHHAHHNVSNNTISLSCLCFFELSTFLTSNSQKTPYLLLISLPLI